MKLPTRMYVYHNKENNMCKEKTQSGKTESRTARLKLT